MKRKWKENLKGKGSDETPIGLTTSPMKNVLVPILNGAEPLPKSVHITTLADMFYSMSSNLYYLCSN